MAVDYIIERLEPHIYVTRVNGEYSNAFLDAWEAEGIAMMERDGVDRLVILMDLSRVGLRDVDISASDARASFMRNANRFLSIYMIIQNPGLRTMSSVMVKAMRVPVVIKSDFESALAAARADVQAAGLV